MPSRQFDPCPSRSLLLFSECNRSGRFRFLCPQNQLAIDHEALNEHASGQRRGQQQCPRSRKQMFKPVLQRLARTYPVHSRKPLYLSHAAGVVGMPVRGARALLRDLTEHAAQIREFVCVHKWTLHDLVMWDNRQTMHRVRRYDQSAARDMRRATVAGTCQRWPRRRSKRQFSWCRPCVRELTCAS
ncbi:MAG: TauD/TfdA family dioxygenase [Bradyrhizobium sp.]|nr:TauD/TfdA family dioxygenase [Bradyrhizobium sp.]